MNVHSIHRWKVSDTIICLPGAIAVLTTLSLLTTVSYGQTCTLVSARQAVEQLQDNQKRPEAQKTLTKCGTVAANPLANALSNQDAKMRLYAAETLGQIGWEAKAVVPILESAIKDDPKTEVRDKAVTALAQIVQDSQRKSEGWQGWQTGEIRQLQDLKQQLDDLRTALDKDKQEWQTKATDSETLRLASQRLESEIEQFTEQPTYKVVFWGQNHSWIVGLGVGVVLLVSIYGAVFWLQPLWLLKLEDGPIQAIANLPHVGTALSGVLKVLLPLKYHPRVLDAWVEQHWQQVETAFLELKTVQDRQLHIALPVCIGQEGTFINELSGSDLAAIFQKRPAVLLITGEGGAGKTSLACQIALWGLKKQFATHRLLPVLIETELDEKKTLLAAIRGQLNALTNETDAIPTNLLEKLLQRQRILVIVDHFSEMGEVTRQQVTPELADFPAKALVITSRLEESLGGVTKTILKPLRIEANRLLGFVQAYVRWRLKKQDDPFIDDEYAVACDRLRRMVGQRNITVLLARLYAEQMIEQQRGAGGMLPASVPELMLCYLNQLNRTIEDRTYALTQNVNYAI